MTRTVTAAVTEAALSTRLRALAVPEVGPDDGLLAVETAGICGTDWEYYTRERGRDLGPLILGHENVGRVEAVGERAAQRWGVSPGDRVAVEEFLPCGTCRWCRSGHYRVCPATDHRSGGPFLRYGATSTTVAPGLWGGFSELLYLHPRALLYPVSDRVPSELAALFVPIANGIRWVLQEAGGAVGRSLVVQGPGQHGLGCVVAGVEAGMEPIVVVGLAQDRHRLDVARRLGATAVVQADHEDAVAAVGRLTAGRGADVVVDVTPVATRPVELAIEMVATRGVVVLAGSKQGQGISGFPHDTVVRKEVAIRGVRGHDQESVVPALRIIESGRHPLELMATHRFGLGDVDRALRVAGERTDPDAIHVNVVPT